MSNLRISYKTNDIDTEKLCTAIRAEYWGESLSNGQILQAIDFSYCVSGWIERKQIGFARAVSDRTTCAHIKDFLVFSEFRGQGFGKQLMSGLLEHPDLDRVPSWYLGTRDAHSFYESFGFKSSPAGIYMHLHSARA